MCTWVLVIVAPRLEQIYNDSFLSRRKEWQSGGTSFPLKLERKPRHLDKMLCRFRKHLWVTEQGKCERSEGRREGVWKTADFRGKVISQINL